MTIAAAVSDGLVCISRSVARELVDWLATAVRAAARYAARRWRAFPLGSRHRAIGPERVGDGDAHAALLGRMEAVPAAIMVGTVEPRKGHRQVVAAFDALWQSGASATLTWWIVGKEGVDGRRAGDCWRSWRIARSGNGSSWIQDASDALLELRVYALAPGIDRSVDGAGARAPAGGSGAAGRPDRCARPRRVSRGRRPACVLFLRLDRGRAVRRRPGVVAAPCRGPSPAVGWHAAGYVGGQHECATFDVVLGGRWARDVGAKSSPLDRKCSTTRPQTPSPDASRTRQPAMPRRTRTLQGNPETAMNAREQRKPDVDDSSRRARDEIARHREGRGCPA